MAEPAFPVRPLLRELDIRWSQSDQGPFLVIQDRTGLISGALAVPPALGFLLSLCDGSRDAAAMASAIEIKTGESVSTNTVRRVIAELDEALLFDSVRYRAAMAEFTIEYQDSPDRAPWHQDLVYPADPVALREQLDGFAASAVHDPDGTVRGVISPHIDYQRGGSVYGETWRRVESSVRAADAVVIFGTDHYGGPGRLTLTRKGYRTPLGLLPTDQHAIEMVTSALGESDVFEEEIHHRSEHSIELAAVWLHWALGGSSKPIVPILCGSFQAYTEGLLDPLLDTRFELAIGALRQAFAGRRVLAVAAADLAHVGPAFGDGPFREKECGDLARQDAETLGAICSGDSSRFFSDLKVEKDARKYCGLPPVYLLLRFLGRSTGSVVSYQQCPADENRTSWVSIAGVLLR